MEKLHKFLFGTLFVVLTAPFAFIQWLLLDGEFGHGKAILFVIVMFLLGSAFFFN
jgi:hypothetical protein